MPFHLMNSPPSKYSSIESQKAHEYRYKKFLHTLLPRNHPEGKFFQHREIYFNNNYLNQRQINLQYRQDQRKHEYERIQKENLRFSQRLINAKACLNRHEQQTFFEKHCKLKQRLQHYPDATENPTKTSTTIHIAHKPIDASFYIYNENSRSQRKLSRLNKPIPPISETLSNSD